MTVKVRRLDSGVCMVVLGENLYDGSLAGFFV